MIRKRGRGKEEKKEENDLVPPLANLVRLPDHADI